MQIILIDTHCERLSPAYGAIKRVTKTKNLTMYTRERDFMRDIDENKNAPDLIFYDIKGEIEYMSFKMLRKHWKTPVIIFSHRTVQLDHIINDDGCFILPKPYSDRLLENLVTSITSHYQEKKSQTKSYLLMWKLMVEKQKRHKMLWKLLTIEGTQKKLKKTDVLEKAEIPETDPEQLTWGEWIWGKPTQTVDKTD